jgi:hypothetical protein
MEQEKEVAPDGQTIFDVGVRLAWKRKRVVGT